MANATYQVIELYDVKEGLPRYVAAQRQEESAWKIVWEHRDKLQSRLAVWFQQLAAFGRQPVERVLLGKGPGLTAATAFALARWRIQEIAKMAGCPNQVPDFLAVDLPKNVGSAGQPVAVVEPDGSVVTYPTVAAMARAAHVTRETASRAVRRGLPGRGGRAALRSANRGL